MKAVVIRRPGPPEVLTIEHLPIPEPIHGWVLIRVKAFGLNRSELFTRLGMSPDVEFPRVLGIEEDVLQVFPEGVDKVLELVGTSTLLDSLQCTADSGSVCMTGMVGNAWELNQFSPMDAIPSTVNLTTYSGGSRDFINTPLQQVINDIQEGRLKPTIGRVFKLDDIAEAHRCMENDAAGGKIVVLT